MSLVIQMFLVILSPEMSQVRRSIHVLLTVRVIQMIQMIQMS